jgi:hypothetical protein
MSREASPRAGERFMSINVEDVGAARKPRCAFQYADPLTSAVTFP